MKNQPASTDEVMRLEALRCTAIAACDGEALSRLFSDDYVHCHANAMIHDKHAMIQHTIKNPRTIEPRTPTVRVYGDTAIITGEMVNLSKPPEGEAKRTRLFATQVACRFGGEWKFVSFQATRIAD